MKIIEGNNNKKEDFDADMVCNAILGIPAENEFDARRQEREMDKFQQFVDEINTHKWSWM